MFRRLLIIALASFILAGCLKPMTSTLPGTGQVTANQRQSTTLSGQIGTMKGYHVQLTDLLNDFAKGATVSLIEVSSGNTVGATIANDQGQFVINFGYQFQATRANPTDARSVAYYLEAVKGLKGQNPAPNQAGADAMRLRTVVWYDFTGPGWVSLANVAPGPLTISIATTTVAFYLNQQVVNGQSISAEAYIGSLDPAQTAPADYLGEGNGVLPGTGVRTLTATTYGDLFAQVTNAVVKDQDPLHSIVLSPTGGAVNTQSSFTYTGMSPQQGGIGSTVTLAGNNFEPANMTVSFVGAPATVNVGASSPTTLVVNVPAGARSGLIQLTLNGINTYTTPFFVTTEDGHRITYSDGGQTYLYAVSNSLGTLLCINPDGSTVTLASGLSSPKGVLVNPEGTNTGTYSIYVSDAGNNRVVRMDSTGAMIKANWLSITNPNALALGPDGDLYVSNGNQITRVDVDWTAGTVTNAALATYTGLSGPSAMAFDYNGYLYLVENSQARVRRFQPQAGDTLAKALTPQTAPYNLDDWAYLNDPQGLAIDTAGNCFVTSQTNNVIMRIDPVRNMSSFAGVSGAGSIARDAAGNLYVAELTRNLIRRITLSGDQRIYAYGLSALRGLAVDGSSNLYVALSNSGAILKVSSDGVTTMPLITGIEPPSGVTFRNGKLLIAHNDSGAPNKCGGCNDGPAVDEVTLDNGAVRSVRSVITNPTGNRNLLYWPGAAEVSDDGTTYYVNRLYGTYGSWYDSKWWFDAWNNAGINIINPGAGTNVMRLPIVPEFSPNWNLLGQCSVPLDADRWLWTSAPRRKLVMSTRLNGRNDTQKWTDLTPSFGGTNLFPNEIYDVVYDGSKFAYVACKDGNIYRFDTTNFAATPTTISGFTGGYPYGMTMVSGTLYVTDAGANKLYKVTNPDSTPALTAFTSVAQPRGITTYGGLLYVGDYGNKQILKVDPATMTAPTVHISGLNGSPSRIRAYNDGRLFVRASDSCFYQISAGATPVPTATENTAGCQGCDHYDFYIDGSNNVYWGEPQGIRQNGNNGWIHSHSMIRDVNAAGDDWIYVGTNGALYGMNLSKPEDLAINSSVLGNVYGVAVNPGTDVVYTANTGGGLYAIDPTTRAITTGANIGTSIWGLTYDNSRSLLYAAANGNSTLYQVNPTGWSSTQLKVGLHSPKF